MAETLRIGLLTHSVNPRGGVVHTLELARALHEKGHRVTVFAPAQPGQHFFRTVPHAVSFVPVGPAPADFGDMVGDRIAATARHLRVLLKAGKCFDLLHAHDGIGGNALADLQDEGLIAGFVRTVHHLDDFADARVAAWQRRSVAQAATLLCVSAGWVDTVKEQFGRHAERVDNGVDLGRYTRQADAGDAALAARLGLRGGVMRWLLVGGVEERKNSLRVLQAFRQLRPSHAGAQLIIAGGASLLNHGAAALAFAAELAAAGITPGPGQDVVLTGALPDAEMPALFRSASALVMPSLKEGFGLVVLEALACGTPVVASRIAPFTEYLGDTVAAGHAVYADPLHVASIASAMQRAAEPARRLTLAAAVPPVCHRYDWGASAARHVQHYRQHHRQHLAALSLPA